MSERDELLSAVQIGMSNIDNWPDDVGYKLLGVNMSKPQNAVVDSILAAGYRKPRTITTRDEANALPDRSAILTPGEIIFRKWENYYATGKHAWERELGQMVPAELLSAEGHFPATVLYEPAP